MRVFYIEGQFVGALLWGTPADAVGESADIAYLSGLCPCTFLWNRGGTMIRALSHSAHLLYFRRVLHSFLLGKVIVILMILGNKGGAGCVSFFRQRLAASLNGRIIIVGL